jgi:putative phosphoesterase
MEGRGAERISIGLISDTHGLVRPEVFGALDGVTELLHAGDVGPAEVLAELGVIAPIRAVYGNTDDPWRSDLVQRLELTIGGIHVLVTHGHELGSPTPEALAETYPQAEVIVYGHTHRAMVTRVGDTLVVNPGAAGPRRFDVQPSVARLNISRGGAEVEIIPLG